MIIEGFIILNIVCYVVVYIGAQTAGDGFDIMVVKCIILLLFVYAVLLLCALLTPAITAAGMRLM